MGDRAQVLLFEEKREGEWYEEPIYLYTHWDGYKLKQTIANALDRGRGRWTDPSYLNRIIFSEMVKDDIEGDTGYGLSRNYQDSSAATDYKVYASWDLDECKVVTPESEYTFEDFISRFQDANV